MGDVFSVNAQQNISTTQIQQVNQTCTQGDKAEISDVQVTIIDSHVGDIDLTNQLKIGRLDCVMDALASTTAQNTVKNTASADISQLPFKFDATDVSVNDVTNVYSYQQSLVQQACIQETTALITGVNVTIIDATTGNIRISNVSQLNSSNCNLAASTYQSIANSITDASSDKVTESCCGFDLGMLCLPIIALVALGIVAKFAGPKSKGDDDADLRNAIAISELGNSRAALMQQQKTQ